MRLHGKPAHRRALQALMVVALSCPGLAAAAQEVEKALGVARGPRVPGAAEIEQLAELARQQELEPFVAEDGFAEPPHDLFFVRRGENNTAVIDRQGTYDYQASPMLLNSNGLKDVWFCGGGLPVQGSGPVWHDSVYKARLNGNNQLVGSITLAMPPSLHVGEPDGEFACDVSVIKHRFPGVKWPGGVIDEPGEELFYMYYECAPWVRSRDDGEIYAGPSEICLAASTDGINWMKYSSALWTAPSYLHFGSMTTVPTPVIPKGQVTLDLCEWAYGEAPWPGEYVVSTVAPHDCRDWTKVYATGHPSAISLIPPGGGTQRQIWLYYYDSAGDWNERGMVLQKSLDGFHFDPPIKVMAVDGDFNPVYRAKNQQGRLEGGKIRYYNVPVRGYNGVFIATGANVKAYFSYSFDGVNFMTAWVGANPPSPLHRLAEARSDEQDTNPGPDLCVAAGASAVVANKYGIMDRLTGLDVLTGEGKLGTSDYIPGVSPAYCYSVEENNNRGKTWGLYWIKGDFGQILLDTVQNPCAYFAGKNVRDQKMRDQPNGTQDTIYWIQNGLRYGYLNVADFLAKNNNDPNAYIDISNLSFDRVENECPYGGIRP